ncbi:bifunctional helix-turn-helix transcriptional regulator/GNAT family N-acetyltransferase [Methylobacterium brachythecii]|nr:bifunctional helix-turn-helix transcriptional regulator/GNAT family N-acetyltransferase [Methylobacterium brachythecii]
MQPVSRPSDPACVQGIRDASRRLVREFGFMSDGIAGTDLGPSAVHALIEIEANPGITARDLGELLRLEKSSVSRMLRKLVASADVEEHENDEDGRAKRLRLSAAGRERTASIHAYADRQVRDALGRLPPGRDRMVRDGLRLYADALGGTTGDTQPSPVEIVADYRPGIVARITGMHVLYYARAMEFGQRFESVVAAGLADFCGRLENPGNGIWSAVQDGEIVGSIAIDGEDLGGDIAHLRWFIIDECVRGGGLGRRLLSTALDFVDAQGFEETRLWTVAGLPAARHLYETHGFALAEEWVGDQWGKPQQEQRFVRPRQK